MEQLFNIEEIIDSLVEVTFEKPDDFLKIKETLTRVGIAGKSKNGEPRPLYQSCHILQKRGKFYIVHFKELFALDGKLTDFTELDLARRNTIVKMLEGWGLVKVVKPEKIKSPVIDYYFIKVIPYKEKENWNLIAKYTIGKN